jgi:hypothetical protein
MFPKSNHLQWDIAHYQKPKSKSKPLGAFFVSNSFVQDPAIALQYLSDMREELQKILDNFSYEVGLDWFKKHVEGRFFVKELLSKGADTYNELRLKKELIQALDSMPVERMVPTSMSLPSKPKPVKKKKLNSKVEELQDEIQELQEELQDLVSKVETFQEKKPIKIVQQAAASKEEMILDEEWKDMYKQANHLFEQIGHVQDQERRKQMAFAILDLMDKVEEMWQKKDFIRNFGHYPAFDNAGIDTLTIDQVATRIRTIRTYISKARKGKLDASKIPAWELEILELEKKLR